MTLYRAGNTLYAPVMTLNWNRILSGLLAVVYIVAALFMAGGEGAFKVAMFTIMPLACIWFSEAMGGYTGPTWNGPGISDSSPGIFVAIVGWIVLLLPIAIVLIALAS